MSRISCSNIFSDFISDRGFLIASVVLFALFIALYFRSFKRNRVGDLGAVLLAGGAGLNLLERVSTGCVKDYISFFDLFYFNIPDVLVTTGIILLIWSILRTK